MGKNAQKIVSCVANTTARTNFRVRMIEDLFPVGHQLMNPSPSSLLSSGSTHGRQRAAVAGQRWGKPVSTIGHESHNWRQRLNMSSSSSSSSSGGGGGHGGGGSSSSCSGSISTSSGFAGCRAYLQCTGMSTYGPESPS